MLRTLETPARPSSLDPARSEGPRSGLRGRNRVAEAFYDGPGWQRFRRWERLFLKLQGGEGRARRQVLRHLGLQDSDRATVLEVGCGDGANRKLLPRGWTVFGVDIARVPLGEWLTRDPDASGCLARAEGECLPFADATFDACWTMGGFNHFRDHFAVLREMSRVTRPGGALVVSDEIPNLHRFGIGHLIGVPWIDAKWLGALGLDPEFVAMVLASDFDPGPIVLDCWPDAIRHSIWMGLGYCYVAKAPGISDGTD